MTKKQAIRDYMAYQLSKEGFVAYWKEYCKNPPRSIVQLGEESPGSLECPVKVEEKEAACEICGEKSAEGGKPLLKCGACKVVSYCSKDCQKTDWKRVHKRVCPELKSRGL